MAFSFAYNFNNLVLPYLIMAYLHKTAYSREALEMAVTAVRRQSLTVRTAAQEYGPRSPYMSRCAGNTKRGDTRTLVMTRKWSWQIILFVTWPTRDYQPPAKLWAKSNSDTARYDTFVAV